MSSDRRWMYDLVRMRNGRPTQEWLTKIEEFVAFALSHPECVRENNKIKCPCPLRRCMNTQYLGADMVKVHLAKTGFMYGYFVWNFHGEVASTNSADLSSRIDATNDQSSTLNNYETMEKEKGAPVVTSTLFLHTHTKKNEREERVFSCAKAQAVVNEIEQELPTIVSPDEVGTSQPVDPIEINKAFYKAVKGKSKKQRVYGLTDSAIRYYPEQYTSTATASTSTFDEQRFQQYKEEVDAKMKAEIQQYKEEVDAKMKAEIQQYHEKMEEERRRHDEEMMKRLQELISQQFVQLMASAPWLQWGPLPLSGSQQAIAPWGPPPTSGSHQVGLSWGPSSVASGTHKTSSSWGPPSSFGSQSGIPAQGWWSGPAQGWWGPPQTTSHAPPSTSHAQVPLGGNLQRSRDGSSDTSDSL